VSHNRTEETRPLRPPGVAEPAPPTPCGRHSGRLSLEWRGGVDLDLHCWIVRDSTVVGHVCDRESAFDRTDASIQLSADMVKEGVESISWTTTPDLSLEFAVHSGAPMPSFAGARIDARINDQVLFFEPPAAVGGRWWRLFVVPSGRSPVRLVNDIGGRPPYTE
jgi:hypothetical protein